MKKKLYAAALAFALVISGCGDGGSGNSADKATAVEMRLQRLVGTVTLTNDKGENQSLIEKMRLASGNALATDIESLVMVSLDETKLVTMEEKSKASITAKDKALQLNLEEGNLFFNVKEKIPEGSSFEIHNGNMVCGIRGTSGYEGKDSAGNPVVMATDGKIDITAEDPISHKKVQTTAEAGDMVVVHLDDESEGERQVSFEKKKYKEEDLPAVALDSIKKDDELQTRISEETGFSVEKIKALAEASSVEGSSMYGQAADEFKSKGQEDAVPLMGKSSQIMTKTALKASDTAGPDLNLEIAIIKGLRTTLDTGVKARYNDDALEKLVDTASDQVNKGIDQAVKAGLKDKDIVTAAETMTKAINVSAEKMMDKGLSSEEVTQVVDTIGKVYEQAISTGSRAGGAAEVLKSVETAAARVDQMVETQMQQNSNGEKTATALIGNNTSGQNPENTQPAGQTPAAPAAAPAPAPAAAAAPAQNSTEPVSSSDDDGDDDYSYSTTSTTTATSTEPSTTPAPSTSQPAAGNSSQSYNVTIKYQRVSKFANVPPVDIPDNQLSNYISGNNITGVTNGKAVAGSTITVSVTPKNPYEIYLLGVVKDAGHTQVFPCYSMGKIVHSESEWGSGTPAASPAISVTMPTENVTLYISIGSTIPVGGFKILAINNAANPSAVSGAYYKKEDGTTKTIEIGITEIPFGTRVYVTLNGEYQHVEYAFTANDKYVQLPCYLEQGVGFCFEIENNIEKIIAYN